MSSVEETVEDHLSCPICFEIPENEIYQCQNGHTICSECSTNVKECPQCRVVYGPKKIRNLAVESILDKCKFNCPNKDAGCGERRGRKELQKHAQDCSYQTRRERRSVRFAVPPTSAPTARQPQGGSNNRNEPTTSRAGATPQGSTGQRNAVAGNNGTLTFSSHTQQNRDGVGVQSTLVVGSSTINIHEPSAGTQRNVGYPFQNVGLRPRQISRNRTLTLNGMEDYVVTAENGGNLVVSGFCNVTVRGTLQTVTLSGTGSVKVCGNVEEWIRLNGLGTVEVAGDARGDIYGNGIGDVFVKGRHYGRLYSSGMVGVRVG